MIRSQTGLALPVVLVTLLAVAVAAAGSLWLTNRQQSQAGLRYHSATALAAAEAGVNRALAILETVAPETGAPGRAWRPDSYTEQITGSPLPGTFTLALTDAPDGSVLVTSVGQVAGVTRRLRARVVLASPALLAGLRTVGMIRLERSILHVLPYGTSAGGRPWTHLAADGGVWFATLDIALNDPARPVEMSPGPADPPNAPAARPRTEPVTIAVSGDAPVLFGPDRKPVDIRQLPGLGVAIEGTVLRPPALAPIPNVDREYYRALAAANTENAAINETAGKLAGDDALARKRDSLYSQQHFLHVVTVLQSGRVPQDLRGVIYVTGGVALPEGSRLRVVNGALIAGHTARLNPGASLEITHTAATRAFPGLVALGEGGLFIMEDSRLRVHGLVVAGRLIEVSPGARMDVVGAILGQDPSVGVRAEGALAIIRFDPAVLGTRGLVTPGSGGVVAWVAAWEELPLIRLLLHRFPTAAAILEITYLYRVSRGGGAPSISSSLATHMMSMRVHPPRGYLTLRDFYHSVRSSTRCAAAATNRSGRASPTRSTTRFMASVTSSGAWRTRYSANASA